MIASVRSLSFALALAASVVAACSTFGSADDANVPAIEDAGRATDGASTVADAGDASASDSGDPGGAVFSDRFENGGADAPCIQWTAEFATAVVAPGLGRSGNACRICATTNNGGLVVHHFPTTTAATYSTVMYIENDPKNPTGASTSWSVATAWDYEDDAGVRGYDTRAKASGSFAMSYALAQSTSPGAIKPVSEVAVRISVDGAQGECFLVDDVQLFAAP